MAFVVTRSQKSDRIRLCRIGRRQLLQPGDMVLVQAPNGNEYVHTVLTEDFDAPTDDIEKVWNESVDGIDKVIGIMNIYRFAESGYSDAETAFAPDP